MISPLKPIEELETEKHWLFAVNLAGHSIEENIKFLTGKTILNYISSHKARFIGFTQDEIDQHLTQAETLQSLDTVSWIPRETLNTLEDQISNPLTDCDKLYDPQIVVYNQPKTPEEISFIHTCIEEGYTLIIFSEQSFIFSDEDFNLKNIYSNQKL